MRNVGLDLMRLVAVVLVLGRHLLPSSNTSCVFQLWHTGGWIGVDMFFVLSGFLVSGLLFEEYKRRGSVNLRKFLIRRFFKLYPPLLLLIVATVIVSLAEGQGVRLRQTASELLFLQNYGGALWNHTWSLAVEVHFYGLLVVVVGLFLSSGRRVDDPFRSIPALFLLVAVVCLLMRGGFAYILHLRDHKWLLFGTHARVDSLMFGVLLGYLWHFRGLKDRTSHVPTWFLLLCGTVLLAPAFLFDHEEHVLMKVVGFTLLYVGSGALLLAFLRIPSSNNSVLAACASLGGASYSIYLWHMPVNWWLWRWFSGWVGISHMTHFELYVVFYVVLSLAIGLWLNKLVEVPSLKIRERLFPSTVRAS
jgi:peptidoglycan/LPS O-acetylase OafA/YrhL